MHTSKRFALIFIPLLIQSRRAMRQQQMQSFKRREGIKTHTQEMKPLSLSQLKHTELVLYVLRASQPRNTSTFWNETKCCALHASAIEYKRFSCYTSRALDVSCARSLSISITMNVWNANKIVYKLPCSRNPNKPKFVDRITRSQSIWTLFRAAPM